MRLEKGEDLRSTLARNLENVFRNDKGSKSFLARRIGSNTASLIKFANGDEGALTPEQRLKLAEELDDYYFTAYRHRPFFIDGNGEIRWESAREEGAE